jgi:hypothetical protein
MKFLLGIGLLIALSAGAQETMGEPSDTSPPGFGDLAPETSTTGKGLDGTNLAPPVYPNSGQTGSRSSSLGGHENTPVTQSSGTLQGALAPEDEVEEKPYPSVIPNRSPSQSFERAMSEGKTQTGPYPVGGETDAQAQQAE